MNGCNESAISDLYKQTARAQANLTLSFFEIYSGKVFDLLPREGNGSRVML